MCLILSSDIADLYRILADGAQHDRAFLKHHANSEDQTKYTSRPCCRENAENIKSSGDVCTRTYAHTNSHAQLGMQRYLQKHGETTNMQREGVSIIIGMIGHKRLHGGKNLLGWAGSAVSAQSTAEDEKSTPIPPQRYMQGREKKGESSRLAKIQWLCQISAGRSQQNMKDRVRRGLCRTSLSHGSVPLECA